jgi:hypothetical protein
MGMEPEASASSDSGALSPVEDNLSPLASQAAWGSLNDEAVYDKFELPQPNTFNDRVIVQCICNADIQQAGSSRLPDQGGEFGQTGQAIDVQHGHMQ